MNRLYIISDTVESGDAFATKYGFQSGAYSVLTKLSDVDGVPSGVIFVHDSHHPVDSIAIATKLKINKCLGLGEESDMRKFVYNLISTLSYVNSTYGYGDDVQVRMGMRKLQSEFNNFQLDLAHGFSFTFMYNLNGKYFYVVPQSEKSKVIVNLIKWGIYENKNNMSMKIDTGITTYDPHGLLDKKSDHFSWM